MKTFHIDLQAQYAAEVSTLAKAIAVTRLDGQTFYWTDHDQDRTIAGQTYLAAPGLRLTALHSTRDLAVNTIDATIFLSVAGEAAIEAGVWDEAAVTIFEYDWDNPPASLGTRVNTLMAGTLGPINRQTLTATVQVQDWTARLNRRIGRFYTPNCPWYHAQWTGATYVSSVECGVSLSGRIHTATITSVSATPQRQFSASALAQAVGYFDEGFLAGLTGDNAGVVRKVRRWEAQTFYLHQDFPYAVDVGDTFSAVQGDDHTPATCKNVYNNKARFGGFEFVPGVHLVYATPTAQ